MRWYRGPFFWGGVVVRPYRARRVCGMSPQGVAPGWNGVGLRPEMCLGERCAGNWHERMPFRLLTGFQR